MNVYQITSSYKFTYSTYIFEALRPVNFQKVR